MSQQNNECELCQQRFSLFRRKKQCDLCGQEFCSKCAPKTVRYALNNSRSCRICLIIVNEQTTHEQLDKIETKHLRAYLIHSQIIPINHLQSSMEKQDLISIIQSKKQHLHRDGLVFVSTNDLSANEQATTETATVDDVTRVSSDESSVQRAHRRANLSDISSVQSIQHLSVRQLKEILVQNFVSIKGCVEKTELISKVELLYQDHQHNSAINDEQSHENRCKVCLDAHIDCVFLDCGHLCTCVQCGKQLSECPICRSYIVRVVRVFKS